MKKIYTIFILLFAFISNICISQNSTNFKNYGVLDGLPNNYIYGIDQDSLGYLWLATGDGLIKMDEKNYTNTTKLQTNSEKQIINTIKCTKSGKWFSNKHGGIFNLSNHHLKKIASPFTQKLLSCIEIDYRHILFISQTEGGFIIDTENFTGHKVIFTENRILNCEYTYKQLYISTENGTTIFNYDKGHFKSLHNIKYKLNTSCVLALNKTDFLIGTNDQGVFLYDDKTKKISPFYTSLYHFKHAIKHIFQDSYDNIWFSTFGEGVICFSSNKEGQYNEVKSYKMIENEDFSFCNQVFEDYEKNIWIGTYGKGLNLLTNNFISQFNPNLIKEGTISAISNQNNTIFYSIGNSLIELGFNHQKNTILKLDKGITINNIEIVGSNKIYIGTEFNGLFIYDLNTKKTNKVKLDGLEISNKITDILWDNEFIWVASYNGLFQLDKDSKIIKNYSTKNGLRHNLIYTLALSKDNSILVGTKSNRLFTIRDNKVYEQRLPVDNQLVSINIIKTDASGKIYAGTTGNGLFVLDGKKIKHFTTEHGLESNFISGLNLMNQTHLLIFSESDISVLDLNNQHINIIKKKKTIPSSYIPNANVSKGVSEIYIGTKTGLYIFDIKKYLHNEFKPKLSFNKLIINDSIYNIKAIHEVLELAANKYKIEFDFKGVNFTHSEDFTYYYKLEGYDNQWQTSDLPYVIYKHLGSGKYQFKVKVCNQNFCTEIKSDFVIEIKKPFWSSTRFISVCILISIWLIIFAFIIQDRNNKRNKKILEYNILLKNQELKLKETDLTDNTEYTNMILKSSQSKISIIQNKEIESFWISKSMHLIGQDLMWCKKHDDKIVFALIDTQKTGIPCGVLKIFIANKLHQTVVEHNTFDPTIILKRLQETVQIKLKSEGVEHKFKATIGVINLDQNELKICSAKQDFIIINQNQEVEIIKGENTQIGEYFLESLIENHVFNLKKINSFYILTDGFESYNKLSLEAISKIILSSNGLEINGIKENIEIYLDGLKSNKAKADDLNILGFKILR